MLGPIRPLEHLLSDQHDHILCRQGPDKTFRVQHVRRSSLDCTLDQ